MAMDENNWDDIKDDDDEGDHNEHDDDNDDDKMQQKYLNNINNKIKCILPADIDATCCCSLVRSMSIMARAGGDKMVSMLSTWRCLLKEANIASTPPIRCAMTHHTCTHVSYAQLLSCHLCPGALRRRLNEGRVVPMDSVNP